MIDDRNGEILERFISPPRRFGAEFAARNGEFAELPRPGFAQPPPGPGFSDAPNGGPAPKSAYGASTNVHIPSAISPYGSEQAPTKPKLQSGPTARKTPSPMVAPPLPPPAPREVAKPDERAPPAPKPEPKIESPPGESENASSASAPTAPEAAKIESQPEAQIQPSGSAPDPTAKPAPPASSAEASDKSKISIVPAALFE